MLSALITQRKLLSHWFSNYTYAYPWSRGITSYRVWISEIMLQQTVVTSVINYFDKWMERFPDIETLAMSDEAEVLLYWQGLGYYSRARNILKTAKILDANGDKQLPCDYKKLRALPGIGDYTACAILSIAYEKPYALFDANVKRIVQRLLIEETWTSAIETKVKPFITKFIEPDPAILNVALMQLGQRVCLKQNPLCQECVFQKECGAYAQKKMNEIPLKQSRKIISVKSKIFFFTRKNGGEYEFFFLKRGTGLGRELFFPIREVLTKGVKEDPFAKDVVKLKQELARLVTLPSKEWTSSVKHAYTHYQEQFEIKVFDLEKEPLFDTLLGNNENWFSMHFVDKLPMFSSYKKLWLEFLKQWCPSKNAKHLFKCDDIVNNEFCIS